MTVVTSTRGRARGTRRERPTIDNSAIVARPDGSIFATSVGMRRTAIDTDESLRTLGLRVHHAEAGA